MKRTKRFTIAALAGVFVILIVTGCKKSNDSNTTRISATIGGTAWQSQYCTGYNTIGWTNLAGYYGKSGDTSYIAIQIHDSVKVNEPDPFYITTVSYTKGDGTHYVSDDFAGGHGTLTVTSWDQTNHKIAGTFSGVLYNYNDGNDSVKIDNGHFNNTYIVY